MVLEKPRVTMTIAELEALAARPENSAKSFEMLEGELYEMDTPAPMHSYIATRILVTLYLFVEAHHPGVAMGDNTGYALSGDTLLVPDISFVAQSRLPAFPWPARFSFAPDVAVEVLSPANKPRDLLKKVQTYLKYGTRQVWVVDPDERVVDVYSPMPDGALKLLTVPAGGTLTGGEVLPGFAHAISDFFPPPGP